MLKSAVLFALFAKVAYETIAVFAMHHGEFVTVKREAQTIAPQLLLILTNLQLESR